MDSYLASKFSLRGNLRVSTDAKSSSVGMTHNFTVERFNSIPDPRRSVTTLTVSFFTGCTWTTFLNLHLVGGRIFILYNNYVFDLHRCLVCSTFSFNLQWGEYLLDYLRQKCCINAYTYIYRKRLLSGSWLRFFQVVMKSDHLLKSKLGLALWAHVDR